MAPPRSTPLSADMNKFYKKYVCYDPNLSRFSELGNVTLNKTFWERTYATNRKFTHLYPVVDLNSPSLKKNELPAYLKHIGGANNKIKKSTNSTDKESTSQSKTSKKLKNLELKPQPPVEDTCPFDECWPKSTFDFPSCNPTSSQVSKHSLPLRRVSRLPSLPKIVETDFAADSSNDKNKPEPNSVARTILSLQHSLKPGRKAHSLSSKETNASQATTLSIRIPPSTIDNEELSPRKPQAGNSSRPSSNFSLPSSIAKDKLESWKDHRPKMQPSPVSTPSRLIVTKELYSSLLHRQALRHPLKHLKKKPSETFFEELTPSRSLSSILDSLVSIPVLKRVELYSATRNKNSSVEVAQPSESQSTMQEPLTL